MTVFYYCSEECARDDLPVECQLVRYLSVEGMDRKAAVFRTLTPIYRGKMSDFVALAKGLSKVDEIFEGKLVGVYLLPLDYRAGETNLDLSKGLQPVQDWGALTTDRDAAVGWQIK
jgi:hypothetical protein